MKTFSAKPADVTRQWYLIDASESTIGRVSTKAASLLIGKGKPSVTSHVDSGDFVVIINAEKIGITGNKLIGKKYYHHSHYPGGIKETNLGKKLDEDPTDILVKAIRGMLPVNKLRDGRLQRLKIYAGSEHPHDPQQPQKLSLKEGK